MDPLVIGFNADPDGDRVPNGLEHILVTDPNASSETFKTLAAPAAGTFVGVHRKIRGITDVQVGYQWSTDLSEWRFSSEANAAGDIISISTSTVLDTLTYQEVEVTGTVLNGTPSKVFLRIIAAK